MEPGAVQSAGLLESDLAWAPTHTLTNSLTEVVDLSAATSILAAGTVGRFGSSDAHSPCWRRRFRTSSTITNAEITGIAKRSGNRSFAQDELANKSTSHEHDCCGSLM
jgi:hypothetical protein